MRYEALLTLVLGREIAVTPASLAGFRTVWAKGEGFPMMIEAAGDAAPGILAADLSDDDVARLIFYEGAFSFDLVTVTVDMDAGPVPAQVFVPQKAPWQPGDAWDLRDWQDKWGTLTLKAAAEVMRAYGRETAAEVGQRFGIIRARAQAEVRGEARVRPMTVSSSLGRDDLRIDALNRPYENFFAVEEYQTSFRRFDGTWSTSGERAIYRVADAVSVLPYDPVRDSVLLVEQLRLGPYALGDRQPWLLEPVAGIVDAGEDYEATARRETMEEAHIALSDLHKVAGYYPSPGGVAQYLVSYIGIADLPADRKRTGGLDQEGEDIRNVTVSFDDLMAMLQSGELCNAPLIMSVQWLALHRDGLRNGVGGQSA